MAGWRIGEVFLVCSPKEFVVDGKKRVCSEQFRRRTLASFQLSCVKCCVVCAGADKWRLSTQLTSCAKEGVCCLCDLRVGFCAEVVQCWGNSCTAVFAVVKQLWVTMFVENSLKWLWTKFLFSSVNSENLTKNLTEYLGQSRDKLHPERNTLIKHSESS